MLARLMTGLLLGAMAASSATAADFPPVSQLPVRTELPDPLEFFTGGKVASKEQWFDKRRPELKGLIQHYEYGFLPPTPEKIDSQVAYRNPKFLDGKATLEEVVLTVGPASLPRIHVLLITPNQPAGTHPVFVGLNFCGNHSVVNDKSVSLPDSWIRETCMGVKGNHATEEGRGSQADVWNVDLIVERGYALATFYQGDVDPDKPDFTDGIHPHFLQGKPAAPDSFGTIAAWAWGYHRVVDYVVTRSDLDTKRIAVVGHSRNGKTALLAGALDDRIDLIIPHQAGCGGTAPCRHKVGETVKAINDRFPHWFDDVFCEFNDQVEKLPFDQHALVALCAPRPVLFSNAVEDTWADPDGQFRILQAAEPVYKFLGVDGLGAESPPEPGKLLNSRLGYFIRPGKHSMNRDDWKVFLDFADKQFGKQP